MTPLYSTMMRFLLLCLLLCTQAACLRAQNVNWAFSTGGALDESPLSNMPCVHTDNAGNVYQGGIFESSVIDVDPTTGVSNIANSGNRDGYFAKYAPSGSLVWSVRIGGGLNDGVNGIGTDNAGNVYVTGYFNGSIDLDPSAGTFYLTSAGTPQTLSGDVFLAKYNSAGQFLWAVRFGSGTCYDFGWNLTVTPNGVVYVYGVMTMTGNVDVDPSPAIHYLNANSGNAFCAKFNTYGQFMGAINLGGAYQNSCVRDVKLDNNGTMYLGGYLKGNCDIDPGPGVQMISSNSEDAFLLKLDTNFNFQWGFTIRKDNTIDEGFAISMDQNNVYFSGYVRGTNIDFDPSAAATSLSCAGNTDNFIAAYTNQGHYKWAKVIGGTGAEWNVNNTYSSGNVILSGYFSGTVDFDPSAGSTYILTSNGGKDGYCLKLDTNGLFQCVFQAGGAGDDHIHSTWFYAPGKMMVNGTFQNTINIPASLGSPLTSNGGYDLFLADVDWVCGCDISYKFKDTTIGCRTLKFVPQYIEGETATSFTWYFGDGSTSNAILPTHTYTAPGTYSVSMVAVTASGCKDSVIRAVNVVAPDYTIQPTINNCGQVLFSASHNGGPPATTISWLFGDGAQASGLPAAHVYTPGSYTASLIVTDAQGCADTAQQQVVIPSQPAFSVIPLQAFFCLSDTIALSASGGVSYQWYPTTNLSNPTIPDPVVYPNVTTTYHVIIANSCNQKDTLDVIVHLLPTPDIYFVDTALACGLMGFEALNTNTIPATDHQWFFGDGTTSVLQDPTHQYAEAGIYTVTLVAKGTSGCTDTSSWPVVVTEPEYAILLDVGTCGWVQLSAVNIGSIPAETIFWDFDDGSSASGTTSIIHSFLPGIYDIRLIVTDSLGCIDTIVQTLIMPEPAEFAVTPANANFCRLDTIALSATGGTSYEWYPATDLSDPYIADPIAYPAASAIYYVIISDECGRIDTLSVELELRTNPELSLSKSGDVSCSYPAATLTATGCASYNWLASPYLQSLENAAQVVSPSANSTFTVIGSNEYGCRDTASIEVTVGYDGNAPVYAPTAFTPDGNGQNDCWRVFVNSNVNTYHLTVFNRWGEKVFESLDPSNCWDGSQVGQAQPMATYFYQYRISTLHCGDMTGKGEVTLIR